MCRRCFPDCIADPVIARLRAAIEVVTDPAVGNEGAQVEVVLADGRRLRSEVLHARGSESRPTSDADLDAKFRSQAGLILPAARVEALREKCLGAASLADLGREVASALH